MRRATREAIRRAEGPLRGGGSLERCVVDLALALVPLHIAVGNGPPFDEVRWEEAREALVDVAATATRYLDVYGAPGEVSVRHGGEKEGAIAHG